MYACRLLRERIELCSRIRIRLALVELLGLFVCRRNARTGRCRNLGPRCCHGRTPWGALPARDCTEIRHFFQKKHYTVLKLK